MVFQVRADDTVYVAMEAQDGVHSYKLEIGADGNRYTRLLTSNNDVVAEQVRRSAWLTGASECMAESLAVVCVHI